MRKTCGVLTMIALGVSALLAGGAEPDREGLEFFEKKIRPVLIESCYKCHSAETKKPKGGLLLDTRAGLLKGGDSGPALVPGKAGESLLLKSLHHADTLKMPPKGKLPDAVIADFTRWVATGAVDPREGKAVASTKRVIDLDQGRKAWAFAPLAPGQVPAVRDGRWARTPIDRYILTKLEAKQLTPNAETAREKLIRRAYFDLWGLPPAPADIEAFVKDSAPDAYEKLLDRLLASERYGERWARHWLDAVRYAESGGYEFDKDRPGAYQYRDWVIKALNQGMGYNEFVRLQVAGDHLKPGDFSARAATGFLVAGPYPGQITAKTQEIIRYDHLDDMVSTLGTSMLGLSMGCCRCHEHKYDPIPQEDYYRLLACLSRTDSSELKLDPQPEIYQQAKAEFDKAHAPLLAARDKFEKDELPGRVQKWQQAQGSGAVPAWLVLDLVASTGKTPVNKLEDGSLLAQGKGIPADTYTFVFHTQQKAVTALRLEALKDASLPKEGPGRGPDGNFALTGITVTAAPLKDGAKAKPQPVKLQAAQATFEQPEHPLAAALAADKKTGWSIGGQQGRDHAAVFDVDPPVGFDGGTVLTVTLRFETAFAIGKPRLAISTAARPTKLDAAHVKQQAIELRTLLEAQQGQVNDANRAGVARYYRALDPQAEAIYAAIEAHDKKQPQPRLVDVFAASSGRGGQIHFLIRGEVERKNGTPLPGFVQVLMRNAELDERWAGKPPAPVEPRVALANWLTDAEQGAGPLLARVIVNRLWQHHLGRGIVSTPNDFGVQGEPPSHPELLDFLAAELIRNGWQLKPIHKLIMTSSVYRQSSDPNPTALQADPANTLWWRRPVRRLEAEAIRDAILAVSGTLDTTAFGPGTLDENSSRRSIYLTVKRSRLVPLMQMFDAPEAIQSIGSRQSTTVATQALALMNSQLARQRADKLAQRIKPAASDALPQAIDQAYLTALGRAATPREREQMLGFIKSQQASYGKEPAALDRALTDFCHVVLCLNEFIYID